MSKVLLIGLLAVLLFCLWSSRRADAPRPSPTPEVFTVVLSDEQWRSKLSTAAYRVLRQASTEAPGTSPLNHEEADGQFLCAGCQGLLFDSADKFDSGTGWPSFVRPAAADKVGYQRENLSMFAGVEVHCPHCGGHLGHVFGDGPAPTGKRFCINGVALEFHPREESKPVSAAAPSDSP